jgi:hypothetical protein
LQLVSTYFFKKFFLFYERCIFANRIGRFLKDRRLFLKGGRLFSKTRSSFLKNGGVFMETIKIADEALRMGAEEGMDGFLQVFIDKYLEVTGGVINAETMPLLNGHQHTLLGYHILREELNVGGFVQLIQNGYGPYIFDNPFAKAMRLFGLKDFSKLIYSAKKIYDENKADLEKERDDDEFMAMYEQYEVFDDLEEEFMDMEEFVTAKLAEYVDEHLEYFAEII